MQMTDDEGVNDTYNIALCCSQSVDETDTGVEIQLDRLSMIRNESASPPPISSGMLMQQNSRHQNLSSYSSSSARLPPPTAIVPRLQPRSGRSMASDGPTKSAASTSTFTTAATSIGRASTTSSSFTPTATDSSSGSHHALTPSIEEILQEAYQAQETRKKKLRSVSSSSLSRTPEQTHAILQQALTSKVHRDGSAVNGRTTKTTTMHGSGVSNGIRSSGSSSSGSVRSTHDVLKMVAHNIPTTVHENVPSINTSTSTTLSPQRISSSTSVLSDRSSRSRSSLFHASPLQHHQLLQEENKNESLLTGSTSSSSPVPSPRNSNSGLGKAHEIPRCMSPTESEVDEFERNVPDLTKIISDGRPEVPREQLMQQIDGLLPMTIQSDASTDLESFSSARPNAGRGASEQQDEHHADHQRSLFEPPNLTSSIFGLFMGKEGANESEQQPRRACSPLTLSTMDHTQDQSTVISSPSIQQALSHRAAAPPSFAESIQDNVVDPRMPAWIMAQGDMMNSTTEEIGHEVGGHLDSFYSLGTSRTVVVHEVVRGNWTWCTCWSPDGNRLAIATENHHFSVVDASASTVWRVKHDNRIVKPFRNGTTHSIRAIAWGSQFIAVGGTGDAVSILSPIEPYPILHVIQNTGFVGSLDWRVNSTMLAIGSRNDKCFVFNINSADAEGRRGPAGPARRIVSSELQRIATKNWANAVSFSPGGSVLAIADQTGVVGIYNYEQRAERPFLYAARVQMDAGLLTLEWSPDGKWLYVGGEDFLVTVIDTNNWRKVVKIERDQWVHFVAASNKGSHLAVGGGTSEVSIIDVSDRWKTVMSIGLKGMLPLSAKWHPQDQYLALTGQDDSIFAVETTNARHVVGHYLQSTSPVAEVAFSPDGGVVAIGNEFGVITFYTSDETTFVTTYEMVNTSGGRQSIAWSPNGAYAVIAIKDSITIVGKGSPSKLGVTVPPRMAGFSVQKVVRDVCPVLHSVSVHSQSRYLAVVGSETLILDAYMHCKCVRRWKQGVIRASAWSRDGIWLATIGESQRLTIFDTSKPDVSLWSLVFTLQADKTGLALSWGPPVGRGLQYLAYGGEDNKISIIEIRTFEGTWEAVLEIPRNDIIHSLDWSMSGLLAAAIGDGTVSIIDLAYLKSGWAVNEMDYNWQRQALTCFTEVRRNHPNKENSMRVVRWVPSEEDEDCFLAVGGSDGAVEVLDLTERAHCKGFG